MSELRPTKKCMRCKDYYDVDDFWNNRSKPDGKQDWCRFCQNDFDKKNPDSSRHNKRYERRGEAAMREMRWARDRLTQGALKKWISGADLEDVEFRVDIQNKTILEQFLENDILRVGD